MFDSFVFDLGFLTKPGTARLQAAVAVNSKSRYGLNLCVRKAKSICLTFHLDLLLEYAGKSSLKKWKRTYQAKQRKNSMRIVSS